MVVVVAAAAVLASPGVEAQIKAPSSRDTFIWIIEETPKAEPPVIIVPPPSRAFARYEYETKLGRQIPPLPNGTKDYEGLDFDRATGIWTYRGLRWDGRHWQPNEPAE